MLRSFFLNLPLIILFWSLVFAGGLRADGLEYVINGVDEPVLGNVRSMVEPIRLIGTARLSGRRLEALRTQAYEDALQALKPFGFYHPSIETRAEHTGERNWRMVIDIDPGEPVRVTELMLEIIGPGAQMEELQNWRSGWILQPGTRLVQPDWDRQLQDALDIAASRGYLLAEFTTRRMLVDLDRKEATLELLLDTGQQAVMGEVRFHQDIVKPHIVDNLPRFSTGDAYDDWIMERFHIDVWRTGYFGNIEVVEDRQLQEVTPLVNLDITAEPRKPNTYQGTIGIGSDTGPRANLSWNRHLLSENGDSFSLGTGWQDHNNEFYVRANYRIPRKVKSRQFWISEALLKRENEDLKVRTDSSSADFYSLGNADIDDYSVRLGRLKVYDRQRGYRQIFETLYAQYLFEEVDYRTNPIEPVPLPGTTAEERVTTPLERRSRTLSLGIEYESPVIRGQGFGAHGHHHRAWAFHSNDAWGSDIEFSQVYLSSRWSFLSGDRWRFLLRGEAGYSDAEVTDIKTVVDGQPIELSVTALPNLYRFKTGGSSSVRGYGFEQLSSNNIGANNVVTASAEVEMKVLENWSVATFFDIGNAFNDWSDVELMKGIGVGIRWYTIAGAVRIDVAKGLDLQGEPWQIHFTIGTSLL